MSRKTQQTAKSSLAGGNTSAIDFALSSDHPRYHHAPKSSKNPQVTKQITHSRSASHTDSDDAASEGIAADDSEGNPSDGADADIEEANDADPDVQAPSDVNIGPGEGQAGHNLKTKNVPCNNRMSFDDHIIDLNIENLLSGNHDPHSTPKEGNVSDDDDYNGVDLISESGDEEPTLENVEERAIIESEEDNASRSFPISPPNSPSDAFSIASADLENPDLDISPWFTDDLFFTEQINLLNHDSLAYGREYHEFTDGPDPPLEVEEVPQRRVRFAEPLMLPSEDEATHFPGSNDAPCPSGLIGTNNLCPTGGDPSSERGSPVTDGEAVRVDSDTGEAISCENAVVKGNDDAASSAGSSSGYESEPLPWRKTQCCTANALACS